MKAIVSVPITTFVYIEGEGNTEEEVIFNAMHKGHLLREPEYRKLWDESLEFWLQTKQEHPTIEEIIEED